MRYRVNDLNGEDSRFLPDGFGAELSWFATAADADKAASALLQRDGGVEWDYETGAVEWRECKGEGGLIAKAGHVTVECYQRDYSDGRVTYGLYAWGYRSARERVYAYCRVNDAIEGPSVAERREARARRATDAWKAMGEPRRDFDAALGTA